MEGAIATAMTRFFDRSRGIDTSSLATQSLVHAEVFNAFIPREALVPLVVKPGKSGKWNVLPGEYVEAGSVIGHCGSSIPVRSPIPGRIQGIRSFRFWDGYESPCAVIRLGGRFDVGREPQEACRWEVESPSALSRKAQELGVMEGDSESVPFSEWHRSPKGLELIIDACGGHEYGLVRNHEIRALGDNLRSSIAIAKRISGASRASIAIDASFLGPDEDIEELKALTGCERAWISPSLYPSGGEQRLAQVFLGKRLANGCDSRKIGAIFTNPSTLLQLAEAVIRSKPVTERFVCVAGSTVTNPSILKARIGTKIGDLIEECGGFRAKPSCVVVNGIFSGHEASDLDEPVLPHSHSIVAYSEKELLRAREMPCIKCGDCVNSCPQGLDPARLFKQLAKGCGSEAEQEGLAECTGCGLCSYVCPSRISLASTIRRATSKGREWRWP